MLVQCDEQRSRAPGIEGEACSISRPRREAMKKVPVGEGGDRFPRQAPDFNAAP